MPNLRRFGKVGWFLVALAWMQAEPVTAQEWANAVIAFTAGNGDVGSVDLISENPCRGSGRNLDLNDALGPADTKFVSIGDTGSIVLGFQSLIVDLPGPDLRVWASCNVSCEPAIVSASEDGVVFVELGALTTSPFGAYDLADAGLSFALHVKVQDQPGIAKGCIPGIGLATDVNAAESLHPDGPTPVETMTWGTIKAVYR